MSRVYDLHMNGDCWDGCLLCEHEELNPPEDDEETDDE